MAEVVYSGGPVFDGAALRQGYGALFRDGRLVALGPEAEMPEGPRVDLGGDILSPGYVDLQVNGGGGVMLGDAADGAGLGVIAAAHRRLGTAHLLPTLITDRPAVTEAVIEAVAGADVPGIAGLHLEGPHLALARKGAHDGTLIRRMEAADLALLLRAAETLPVLKVTLAPENASLAQVAALAEAGVIVALGHTDADFATCQDYAAAGARCVTHLFNAMRQMGSREPGVVGAALANGVMSAGLIADGIHVAPAVMGAAWRGKAGPGRLYLVSDAMAVAGTDLERFALGGRQILRRDGSLRLEDGTLAGADLDLTRAVRVMVQDCGVDLAEALAAATTVPAGVIGLDLWERPRARDFIRIRPDLSGAVPLVG